MQAKNLIFYLSCNRQALEEVSKHFPYEISAIFFETLIIEAIELVNLAILVIAS
jgi:hypothetical protein